jgi:GGDEF domain-containing protein
MKRGSILLAIVFTITIPAIIAWPALRIAGAWTDGQESVRSSFGALRRLAINSINHPSSIGGNEWTNAALKAWENDDRLLAIVISDTSGTVLYALPDVSPYYVEPKPDTKGPEYLYPENTVARFNGVIASGLVLDALYTTLRQGELYKPLKDATLSLLALLALTAAWLIAASATNTAADSSMATATDPEAATASAPGMEFSDTRPGQSGLPGYGTPPLPDNLGEFPELMELSSPPASIGFLAMSEISKAEEAPKQVEAPETVDEVEEIELLTAEIPLPDPSETPVVNTRPMDGPRGLYDPETGLGWESYLRERLGAELRRSASFEHDLSILVASLDSATGRTDPNYAVFAKASRNFFSFNDLAFIFGTKGLAIILPNTDIDQAMRMSEELLKKLALLIQDRSDPMSYLNLFMGLSSRSGRLVEADRLLGEAMAAHRKAREERDTHIMAFRPDPEKFRAYLANK